MGGTGTGTPVTTATTLFTTAEARAFNNDKLTNATTYPTADITEAEARIRARFEDIIGIKLVSTSTSEYVDGAGDDTVFVPNIEVTAVTACVVYDSEQSIDETFDAGDLTDLAIYPSGRIQRRSHGYFLYGHRNVYITYTHGLTTVPSDLKRAALVVCLNELTFSGISDRATSYSDGAFNYQMATAGRNRQPYGLPQVDSVLMAYRDKYYVPGLK